MEKTDDLHELELYYLSTRGLCEEVQSSEAVRLGIAPDGGLFVPARFPSFDLREIASLAGLPYHARASRILSPFFPDIGESELARCSWAAYDGSRFDCPSVAPVKKLNDSCLVLELWHGPTCAFKDMALQFMPHLLTTALNRLKFGKDPRKARGRLSAEADERLAVLVATSGDTGKAALEGFRDVDGTFMVVFYPAFGVSEMQRLQMVTQEGKNVAVVAVEGNFDDAQDGVKAIFGDISFSAKLQRYKVRLSSANSINWGRLAPQIVYYFSAYADMLDSGEIRPSEKVNFVVPTGNFGNILAGFYAKQMGLPVHRLICATNMNNVLEEFIKTGRYDRNRPFVKTISPSMDILISSNLERLLYELTGRDALRVRRWMESLAREGVYRVDPDTFSRLTETFWSGSADDERTKRTIHTTWRSDGYLLDPHTAVAKAVYEEYLDRTGDPTKTVIVSTASPFKFAGSVAGNILGDEAKKRSELELLEELAKETKWEIPRGLKGIAEKPIIHTARCTKEQMKDVVSDLLTKWLGP